MDRPNPFKEQSEAWLRERGIPTNNWFATSAEDPWVLRTAAEVARRAMALTVVAACALSDLEFKPKQVRKWLREAQIEGELTPEENSFLANPKNDPQLMTNMGWRIEAAWALCWCLGWSSELGAFEQEPREPWFYEHVFMADTASLLRDATLRPESEVRAALDLTIRVHWAVRHLELEGSPSIPDVDPGVVIERHHAFNWVTDPETPWDDITTDT